MNPAPRDALVVAHPVPMHEIETGKKRGSVDTLKRLAETLGVLVDDLV